jgi:hypothetical protein
MSTVDHRAPWIPGVGAAVTTATIFVDLLLLRALDDLRDLPYDRAHSPRRPLPSGRVRTTDLWTLIGAGVPILVLGNAWRGTAGAILVLQLGYALGLVAANLWLRRPATENTLVQLAVNAPIQLLLSGYVYAAGLADRGAAVTGGGIAAVGAVALVLGYLEFARKTTRYPKATERTYVHQLGVGGTVAVAGTAAVLSAVCALVALRPLGAWGWLALAPLAIPAGAGYRFWRRRLPRWPVPATLGFVLSSFAVFLALGWAAG